MKLNVSCGIGVSAWLLWFCVLVLPVSAQEIFIPEGNPQITLEGMLLGSRGVAVDHDNNIYIADTQKNVVRKYLPDGSPLTVFGREFEPGFNNGLPVDVRFALPFRLVTDLNGDILVADDSHLIRRINTKNLVTTTIADISNQVDGSQMYHVITGTMVDEGTLNDLRIGDMAIHPNGDIFVTAADRLGVRHYLIRIRNGVKKAIGTSAVVAPLKATGSQGTAVDRRGEVFVQFPAVPVSGTQSYSVYRFPGGTTAGVNEHYSNLGFYLTMAAGLGDSLYLASGVVASPIAVISSVQPNTFLRELNVIQTFPALPSQQIRDIALDLQGTLYAVNERVIDGDGVPTPPVAKVDRFLNIDARIGAPAGDIELPQGTLTFPLHGQIINTPVILHADASDNSGNVIVQFKLDDADFGPALNTPPYQQTLNPAGIPGGNHRLYAILRDGAGNARATNIVTVLTVGGLPNPDGEIFVSDLPLNEPVGVATDDIGNVYVADMTRILKFSPLGELLLVYGSNESGFQDGGPVKVRFGQLKGLGKDRSGNIVIIDDSIYDMPYVRLLDPLTGITGTLIKLDETAGIDVSNVFDVTTGTFIDLVATNPLCEWLPCNFSVIEAYDAAGASNGDIFIGTSNGSGIQDDPFNYVLRYRPNGITALVRASITYGMLDADRGARSVAVDAEGNFYAGFPEGFIIADHDTMFRFSAGFPVGGANAVQPLFSPLMKSRGLLLNRQNRLYVTQDARNDKPARVNIVSSSEQNTVLQILNKRLFYNVHDVAIDNKDNVYVTSNETQYFGNKPFIVSRVTRFSEISATGPLQDRDGDGYLNEDELASGSDPDNARSIPGTTTMKLKIGYNQISFPAETMNYGNLMSLMQTIGGNNIVSKLLVFNPETQIYDEAGYDEQGQFYGQNIALPAGQGIAGMIVYAKQDATLTFTSKYCHTWNLKEGTNLVGTPCAADNLTSFELLQRIGDESVITSIQRYDPYFGLFETAGYLNGQPAGVDFPIKTGEGYFIYMKQDVTGIQP